MAALAEAGTPVIQQTSEDSGSAPRYIRVYLLTTLLCCLGLGAFNYTVNPLGYYAPHLLRQLTWDEVQWKLRLMRQKASPDLLILGSSRVMTIAPSDAYTLTGQSAFNAGTGAAAPVDSCAMLRYAVENCHWRPREIMIGIDLEAFSHGSATPGITAAVELSPFLPISSKWQGFLERWNVLLSTEQTKASLRSIRLALRKTGYGPPSTRFTPDGLLQLTETQWGDHNLREELRLWSQQNANFAELDPSQKRSFEEMLQVAADHHSRIIAFVTPYQPSMYRELRSIPHFNARRQELMTYLGGLQRRFPNFSYRDLTEISSFGGDITQFLDFIHIRQENGRRILKQLLL